MAKGVNKAILIGNLGADPEVRYTQSGSAIATIKIATSESWKDKTTGEQQERTEWHRVKFFGRLAEIVGEYLKKGRQVYIEGSLRTEKYTDKDGIERYTTDIIADEMQMLGSNPGGDDARGNSGGGGNARGQGGQRQAQGNERASNSGGARAQGGGGQSQGQGGRAPTPANAPFEDDEVPFDLEAHGPR